MITFPDLPLSPAERFVVRIADGPDVIEFMGHDGTPLTREEAELLAEKLNEFLARQN